MQFRRHTDFFSPISDQDEAYFSVRAAQEEKAAVAATCAAARERHEEMAEMYRERVRFGSRRPSEIRKETVEAA